MGLGKYFNMKIALAGAVLLIILFFTSIISFFVDYQWYNEVGYTEVFFTRLFTQFKIGIPIFLFITIIVYLYLLYLKREYLKESNIIYSKEQIKSVNSKLMMASIVVSFITSTMISSSYWYDILKFMNSTTFNLSDPLFNKDISFYVFDLPIYKALYGILFGLIAMVTFTTLLFYLLTSAKGAMFENDGNVLRMGRRGRAAFGLEILEYGGKKLAYLAGAIFLLIGAGFILRNYNLVYSPRGVAFGASYTDVFVTLVFNKVLAGLSVLAAISVFFALYKRKAKMALWVVGIMIGASLIQGVAETAVQRLIVSPNEIEKEQEFINYNIKYTKLAFGLDKIEEKDFPAEQNLAPKDIENNRTTINNIRINDFMPALDVYNQIQGMRPYYRFNDVDIDRYMINGKYTQVFISARELDQKRLTGSSQTWLNKHLIYTHGYGITMSPVNTVTAQGQPNLIIKDIPPVTSVDIKIDRPQIYFGELADDYIITNTRTPEMDYPSGETNKETFYDGKAGIKLGVLNRLLFTINKGSFNFLLTQDINSNSRIIMNRNIAARVQKIAPFLLYDKDPYIVINNNKLYWIIDAYTVSSAYPYSEPLGGVNYIRNSVKVIIDAYDGTTNFYLIDDKDPLAVTYSKVFPDLFKKNTEIPAGFIDHFRYPQDIFTVQMEAYKKYHMTNPRVFYQKEDLWSIAGENKTQGQQNGRMDPSYIVMKLPGGVQEEFMLMIPYTPNGKENMVAWLGARMDKENYGKLIVYKFPKQKMTYGPTQFKARFNQEPSISKEISLWNQQGSGVIYGNIVTIPIETSLLYVMPVYIKSTGQNSIPEMKRVVLGYGDRIVMEETLERALSNIFDLKEQITTPPPVENRPPAAGGNANIQELVREAGDAFNKAKEAQQRGDWAEYGRYLKELEETLKQLDALSK